MILVIINGIFLNDWRKQADKNIPYLYLVSYSLPIRLAKMLKPENPATDMLQELNNLNQSDGNIKLQISQNLRENKNDDDKSDAFLEDYPDQEKHNVDQTDNQVKHKCAYELSLWCTIFPAAFMFSIIILNGVWGTKIYGFSDIIEGVFVGVGSFFALLLLIFLCYCNENIPEYDEQ